MIKNRGAIMILYYKLVYSKGYVNYNRENFNQKELAYLKTTHQYKYDNDDTIKDLFVEVSKQLTSFYKKCHIKIKTLLSDEYLADLNRVIINKKELYVFNLNAKISKYTELFGNEILIFLMETGERGGDIWRENGIRYYMHSNENTKHSEPHVHVKVGGFSASIRIADGKILAGKLPPNKKKYIINRVLRGKDELLFCWKTKTNGNISFNCCSSFK